MNECDKLPIPPMCSWIRRRNDGVIEVSTPRWLFPKGHTPHSSISEEDGYGGDGLEHDFAPLAEMLPLVGETWQTLEFLNPWFRPYLRARVQMAFMGVDEAAVKQWEQYTDD